MTTATTGKATLENIQLRSFDYYGIIPPFSHFTMLANNASARLVRTAELKKKNERFTFVRSSCRKNLII